VERAGEHVERKRNESERHPERRPIVAPERAAEERDEHTEKREIEKGAHDEGLPSQVTKKSDPAEAGSMAAEDVVTDGLETGAERMDGRRDQPHRDPGDEPPGARSSKGIQPGATSGREPTIEKDRDRDQGEAVVRVETEGQASGRKKPAPPGVAARRRLDGSEDEEGEEHQRNVGDGGGAQERRLRQGESGETREPGGVLAEERPCRPESEKRNQRSEDQEDQADAEGLLTRDRRSGADESGGHVGKVDVVNRGPLAALPVEAFIGEEAHDRREVNLEHGEGGEHHPKNDAGPPAAHSSAFHARASIASPGGSAAIRISQLSVVLNRSSSSWVPKPQERDFAAPQVDSTEGGPEATGWRRRKRLPGALAGPAPNVPAVWSRSRRPSTWRSKPARISLHELEKKIGRLARPSETCTFATRRS
jgi:hypothetical protein